MCERKPANTSIMRAYSAALVVAERRSTPAPTADGGVSVGPGRDDARGELARERALAPRIPAVVEAAAVAVDPLGRRLVRRVARTERQVEEERLVGVGAAQVGRPLPMALVDQVLGEVVAVGRRRTGSAWLSITSSGEYWLVSPPMKP